MSDLKRRAETIIANLLEYSPAVYLNGPRQSGKSTVAENLANTVLNADYLTFDEPSLLSAAQHDAENFLAGFPGNVVIDEAQMAPAIFRLLKKAIDQNRRQAGKKNRKYLLTGSADVMALPELADALVGRVLIQTLYPFSMGELLGKKENFIAQIFSNQKFSFQRNAFTKLSHDFLTQATFPEIAVQKKIDRHKWFESYLATILQRDMLNLADISNLSAVPRMLKLLAAQVGGLLNDASLARDAGLNLMTYRRYRLLLEALFLVQPVRPWFRNISKRLVKAPKIYLVDTALLCHLLGLNATDLKTTQPELFGKVLENFIATELLKQLSFGETGELYHFRTQDGKEIDFVLQRPDGKLVVIEVKSRSTVNEDDFKTIHYLRDQIPGDFVRGIVFYTGKDIIPFGKDCYALPIQALWEM